MKHLIVLALMLLLTACSDNPIIDPPPPPPEIPAQARWSAHASNPVLEPGGFPAWDRGLVKSPSVVLFKDTLRMWYDGSPVKGFDDRLEIGYAWSLDNGLTWQRHPDNPVLSPREDEWDAPQVTFPVVLADGNVLRMWYGGGDFLGTGQRIGYATSTDGVNWNRHPTPVIEPTAGDWNADGVAPGAVIKEDGVFKMWLGGGIGRPLFPTLLTRWSTGFATSPDGIQWTLHNDPATTDPPFQHSDPVLQHGPSGSFDENRAMNASVLRSPTDTGYDMWYMGFSVPAREAGRTYGSIGYATSPDGIQWTKYEDNPVFRPSSDSPRWADGYFTPKVLFDGERFQMWLTGWVNADSHSRIGYATSASVPEN